MEYGRSTVGTGSGAERCYAGACDTHVTILWIQRQRIYHYQHVVTGAWILGKDNDHGTECSVTDDCTGSVAEGKSGRVGACRNESIDRTGCAWRKPDALSRKRKCAEERLKLIRDAAVGSGTDRIRCTIQFGTDGGNRSEEHTS